MLTACWAEPIREPEEVYLIDLIENHDHCTLDDFVLQRRDTQRSLPPVRFRNEPSPNGLRPIPAAADIPMQLLKNFIELGFVVLPRYTVHTWSNLTFERRKCFME